MAWITDADAKASVASVLKFASAASLPSHWALQVAEANEEAYQYIRRVLVGRGFTAAQLDLWDERRVYNRRVMLCTLFETGGLPDDYNGVSLDRVCKAREELATCNVLIAGEQAAPGSSSGLNVGYGDSIDDDSSDGRITLDTTL